MFRTVESTHACPQFYREAWKLQRDSKWEELNRLAEAMDNPPVGKPESIVTTICLVAAFGAVVFGPALMAVAAREAREESRRNR